MSDFYLNKSEQLKEWCRNKKVFSKADLMRYGLENWYLRCDRTVRSWVQQGLAKRLNDREREERGLSGRMAYYEYLGNNAHTS